MNNKKWGMVLVLSGAALFLFGLLNFDPSGSGSRIGYLGGESSWGPSYDLEARLEVSVGVVLIIGGTFLYRTKEQ